MKISIYLLIIFISSLQVLFAQSGNISTQEISLDKKLHIGDEFTYIVKYAFLDLGEVKTIVYDKDTLNGKIIYKAKGYIDSYEGLPFVTLHQVYESWFDTTLHPVFFKVLIFNESDTSYVKYDFLDYNRIHIQKGILNRGKTSLDTLVNLNTKYLDGLSILYYARFMNEINNHLIIPCYINEDTSTTIINYFDKDVPVSIEAVDYEISSFRMEGNIGFTGIFGLTGYFESWFSNDEYNIPLSADLQVIIGDITIELLDWKKSNWLPPAYDNE